MPVVIGWSEAGLNLSHRSHNFFPSGLSAQMPNNPLDQAVTDLPHPTLEDETCP